ncbi:inactive N-acetylated-alpha-linked acidic dipeptidase-like protein 2 [Gadus macrocephalus]|uniref:inactive N-acetylated-alpha-linked acidic dipeptidase-like protein 2 n=1 Tax=Gadus macrocephalus TaxID=80720 RepID=UPI0028CB3EC0|nr:inactive N-acetylated-alpha-linked acidic dipeptidase-like protein 2 [Gadus macrocephalus]
MMAYRKVDDGQGRPLGGEVLQCSEGLGGLDWSLDKEGDLQEPEPGLVRMQLQHAEHQRTGCTNASPDPDLMEPIQPSVSVSPHGRFERLQEDPDYISHFTRCPGHKGQRRLHCTLARYLLAGACFFVTGLLIGRFTRSPESGPLALPEDSKDLLEDLLKGITADKIKTLQSPLWHVNV